MNPTPVWFALPIIVGLVQPIIWAMNVEVSRRTGIVQSAAALHLVGALVGALWLVLGLREAPSLTGLGAVPWWAWFAGAIGVSGMIATNRTIPLLGLSATLAVLVAAQFSASLAFEHYGWLGTVVRPATPSRWAGALLLTVGAWLMAR